MRRKAGHVEMGHFGWHVDALEEYLHETVDCIMEPDINIEENVEMQNEEIIIWTQENCPLCGKIKDIFGEGNYIERDAADLIGGKEPNSDALAQLAMQDMQLPLVMVAGEWKDVAEIITGSDSHAA